MAYEHEDMNMEWPYVGVSVNRDWLLNKVKSLENRLDGLVEEAVEKANKYTDEQLANYQAQVDALRIELLGITNQIETDFDNLQIGVNIALNQMELRINDLQNQLAADIAAVNHRTDLAIEQNNEYILSEVGRFLSQIEVLNYFTGEYVTIQDMFNYLCMLHAQDGILVTDLVNRQKTVNTLVGLNLTMTQIAMYGNSVIPA
ncbi:MAG: DUF1640 domain-containing protein [Elusimicrobiaceae bacterium]|nr:DUF1640 domain-containing protein [Elusimicrobiaceae bacterium]